MAQTGVRFRMKFAGQGATAPWPVVRSCRVRCQARAGRSGFTLLEVLLVVAVMVVIASLAAPNLVGMLETHKLRKSGDMLRSEFARARIEAMKSGRIQMFRYQTDQGGYMTKPWIMADDELEANVSADELDPEQSANEAPSQLPDGVKFLGLEAEADNRTAAIYESIETELARDSLWSSPILFYPDGSSSSARVVLANSRNQVVQVTLRGLTGISEASDWMRPEDLSP